MIINIQFSPICNASCKFCYHAKTKNFLTKSFISWDIIKKIYNDILNINEIVYIICDMAGEALLDKEYFEKIYFLKQNKNIKIVLYTNGILIQKINIEYLNGIDFLVLSFLGDISSYSLSPKLFIDNIFYLHKNNIKFYIKLTYDKEPYTVLSMLSKYNIPLKVHIDKIIYSNESKKNYIKRTKLVEDYSNMKIILRERTCDLSIISDEITIDSEGNSYICCLNLFNNDSKTNKNILTSSLKELYQHNIDIFNSQPEMCRYCILNNNGVDKIITASSLLGSL